MTGEVSGAILRMWPLLKLPVCVDVVYVANNIVNSWFEHLLQTYNTWNSSILRRSDYMTRSLYCGRMFSSPVVLMYKTVVKLEEKHRKNMNINYIISSYITVFYYNYFQYYNEWQRFISDNKDLDIHIVHFEDFVKVVYIYLYCSLWRLCQGSVYIFILFTLNTLAR